MRAIVIILFPRSKVDEREEENRRVALPDKASEQATPFWTWFIENPRLVQPNEVAA